MVSTNKGEVAIVRPPLPGKDRQETGVRREKNDGPRMNGSITARQIRVVDADGEMLGVMTVKEGIALAEEAGLDLVEVSPNADPPVCKIIDYGKYRYELQKKSAEARKKQKVIEIKEIKIRPMIDDHDFGIKMRNAKAFLSDGDKVKITMRFRGREMAHQEIANNVLERVKAELGEIGRIEAEPSFEGRQIVMIIAAK